MADDKYFTGEINEYVDWVSGYNEAEDTNATGRKPVSGGSIRQLLQNHLRKPFILEYDSVSGKNRLFPSAYARNLYYDDPATYTDLLIGEFEAAAGYSIKLYDDDTYSGEISLSDLYIKSGDTTSLNNYLQKYFRVYKGEDVYTCNVYVQATITNSKYRTSSVGSNFSHGSMINMNLTSYIHDGTNTIDVTISAFIGTQIFQRTFTYKIFVVKLNTSVTYDYNTSGRNSSDKLTFKVYTEDTSGASIATVYKIDQEPEFLNTSVRANQDETYNINVSNLSEGTHTLQVMSYIGVMNNGVQNYLYSNVVYIRFVRYTGQTTLHNLVFYASLDDRTSLLGEGETPTLSFTQYKEADLMWALASTSSNVQKNVTWKLQKTVDSSLVDANTFEYSVGKETINTLTFTPTSHGDNYILTGILDGNNDVQFNVNIKNAKYQISESTDFNLKLENTLGYSNDQNREWISNHNGNLVTCLFNRESAQVAESPAFPWNTTAGWGDKCMHLSPGNYIYIPYRFFTFNNEDAESTGATIEIEFEFKSITDSNDEIITIGGGTNNQSKIVFTPTSATLYADNNTQLVKTNFKSNERIKLAFVINKNANAGFDTSLVMIVNNGILERAKKYTNSFTSTRGIKIGKAGAGAEIFIYKIRAYNSALTYEDLFANYALDNDNTAEIISNNNILNDNNEIDYSATLNKLPVIFITGRMNDLIASTGKNMNLNVELAKIDMADTSKNMYIENCRIRKHGQSTLNYPIPSFKIWSNSKYTVNDALSPDNGKEKKADMFGCNLDGNGNPSPNKDITFYKGRYQMKSRCIPANKWVLQANYADSSGVHNGGIMKLITESWYNAKVKVGVNEYYKLRTPPQLITSINSNRDNLDEADLYATADDEQLYNDWVANQSNPDYPKKSMYEYNSNHTVKLWSQCGLGDFPYDKIRVSPDSFPCVIFFRETENDPAQFLGQYVFMDDKKSDYIYGQRSIYKVRNDPFCITATNATLDDKEHRLWNNNNCLRIEVVKITNDLVGYRSHEFNNLPFDTIVTVYETDDDGNYIDKDGNIIQENELADKGIVKSVSPNWYNGFELIYPDPDDLKDSSPQGINNAARPFIEWHAWLVSTYQYFIDHDGTQDVLYSGAHYNPSHDGFYKFRQEAADHLDLYKLAAYYICFLRFGLVDSVERNAQLKTYDGKHWHYEPWDMDIALGNQNTGGIKWNPPMTRATNDGATAAYSGTHVVNQSGQVTIDKSNWLWDALESWPNFQNIVKAVADALSTTLTYDNICKVLDEEYAQKWCERIYNINGHVKYIETSADANMYDWLQGARTSHRHWWLKTSMDYYDARWVCGDFKNTGGYINAKYNGANTRDFNIRISAANKGYFCYAEEVGGNPQIDQNSLIEISGGSTNYVTIPKSVNLEAKTPFYIFGCNNIKELDLSDIYNEPGGSGGIQKIYFSKFIDPVIGTSLKVLNIGVPLSLLRQGITNAENISAIDGIPTVTRSLEELNIQGCCDNGVNSEDSNAVAIDYDSFLKNTENLKRLYAIGTSLTSFTSNTYQDGQNARVYKGGHYEVLQLPDTVTALEFWDTSWEVYDTSDTDPADASGLSFWHYDKTQGTITPVLFENSNVTSLKFYKSTLTNKCAVDLLKAFINKAIASGHPENYTLYAEGINIDKTFYDNNPTFEFTYTDLMNMAQLNGGYNAGKDSENASINYTYRGYLRLSDIGTQDSSEINVRIQNIQTAFGENVFSKTSSATNLVVDFRISNTDDIFLTISSFMGNCYNALSNTITEGWVSNITPNSIIVRASKFLLPDDAVDQTLKIINDNNIEVDNYLGAYVGSTEDLTLLVPEMMRRPNKSQPETITLRVIDRSGATPIHKDITVNLEHKVYPTAINVDVVNASNYHCYLSRSGNTVDVNLTEAIGHVTLSFVYPENTSDDQKATIDSVSFVGETSNLFTISKIDDTHFDLTYNSVVSTTTVNYAVTCMINYRSGDTYDNFVMNFHIAEDDIIVTSSSNPALYNVLVSLNIPCMIDQNNHRLFTRSSLNSMRTINFDDSNTSSAYYALVNLIEKFDVDTNDASKGTIFDYINPATTSININGCTHSSLQSNPTTIDITRFASLESFQSKSNAAIRLRCVATAPNQQSNLTQIYLYNAKKVELEFLSGITKIDIRNAAYVDIKNINPYLAKANFNLELDKSHITHLELATGGNVGNDGEMVLGYFNTYVGTASTIPNEIYINLTWSNKPLVSLSFLENLARYIKKYHNSANCILNGNVALSYHTAELKNTIQTYQPNLIGSSDWGQLSIEVSPDSLKEYIQLRVTSSVNPDGVITPVTLKRIYDNYGMKVGDLLNNVITALTIEERRNINNLLWFRYLTGDEIGQSKNYDTSYPNIKYLAWPLCEDFKIGQYSHLKAEIIVTNNTRPPKSINRDGDHLYYKLIVISKELAVATNGWYDILAANSSTTGVTSGASTDAEKIAALEAVDIVCTDLSGLYYSTTDLMGNINDGIPGITEDELDSLLEHYNSTGAWHEYSSSNSDNNRSISDATF